MPAAVGTVATAGAPAAIPYGSWLTPIAGTSVGDAVCTAPIAANSETPLATIAVVCSAAVLCCSVQPAMNAVIFLPPRRGASGASSRS